MSNKVLAAAAVFVLATGLVIFQRSPAHAHCDTLDGPVVKDAEAALAQSDVAAVLKWIKKEHEAELRAVFARALAVRKHGGEARQLADTYFYEAVVRLHREGEGAPYTGLKAAGVGVSPVVRAADAALDSGSADKLVAALSEQVSAALRTRFQRASETRKHAQESVEAGREFVAAYVEFVHYAEALANLAAGHAAHHQAEVGKLQDESVQETGHEVHHGH